MRRVLVVAAALGLTMAGATVAVSAYADSTPPIAWAKCTDPGLAARKAECGFVTVPRDHAKPKGATIKLAVSRIRHTAKEYQGVMLVNPGGPGGSGLILSALGEFVPGNVGAGYDWIGFDPRGVGSSEPKLSCDAAYTGHSRPPYVPSSAAIEKKWLRRTSAYAKACAKAGGPLLDHLKTVDNARDLESIRRALGVEQINFYGFSYGTYLGQVYATKYPKRVRRMVLDGNVDPRRVWYAANLDQNIAFDRNMKIYFAWLAANDKTYHLGTTGTAVEKLFYATQHKLAAEPAGGVIGPAELTDVFLQPGYYVFGWTAVADAFSAWVNRKDPKPLRALYDQNTPQTAGADNGYAIYLATECTDAKWPLSWSKWRKDNAKAHAAAPFETWGNAWYNAPCRTWAAEPGEPVDVDGSKAPPVLLVSETLDAATPFRGSLEVRKRFPASALVEGVGGTTHAGSLFGNSCVDGAVAAYLRDGTLPKRVEAAASDLKCKPLPQPAPAAATGKIAEDAQIMRARTGVH